MYYRLYEDDNLEKKIKEAVFNNYDFFNVLKKNNYYEYHYFLSELRHSLFTWYPFKKDANLLEIGASYGQLTSLFTKKVANVIAVENTDSKGEIISKRVKNAKVIVSEFDKLEINEKFDYIVLCNIFEYAKSFCKIENPYEYYLRYLKTFLKEDGVILIALSNRLGLKYFSGFREEHTNQFFMGIDGYLDVNHIRTFTKTELINIIQNANFDNYKFFYPYPDHEFPQIINTDKFVNKIPYNKKPIYFDERSYLFSEDILNQSLANDNLADYFSNSFLIEIRNSDNQFESDDIDFVKINNNRKSEFQTVTIIHSNNIVSKHPLLPEAEIHIKKMYDESKSKFGKIKYLPCKFKKNHIYYEFLKGNSLENLIMESILQNDKKKFFKLIEDYYDALFYKSSESNKFTTDKFLSIFKEKSKEKFHCHDNSNLDLNFSNIFIIDNEFVAIDYEWLFDFKVPIEYIFYRTINYYIESNRLFRNFISLVEIFRHFNLNISNIELFKTWDKHLFKYMSSNIQINKHKIIPKENLDYAEKVDKYLEILLDSESINSNKFESLKRDIVLNQRKIINKKNKEIAKKNEEIAKKNKKIRQKDKKIKKLVNSQSWKITKPLRKFKKIFK